MKQLLILVTVLALHGRCIAQDSLEPCAKNFDNPYHSGVNRFIDDAVSKPSRLQLTTIPSFQVESGIRLVESEVYYVEFKSSYWGSSIVYDRKGVGRMDFKRTKIATKVWHAPLDVSVADRVQRAFAKAIANASPSGKMGVDGVSYVFSTDDGACGSTWSPDPKSQNGRLVQLLNRLEKHATFKSPMDLDRSEKSLIKLLQAVEDAPF